MGFAPSNTARGLEARGLAPSGVRPLVVFFLGASLLSGAVQPAPCQVGGFGGQEPRPGEILVHPAMQLPPITPEELTGAGQYLARSAGTWSPGGPPPGEPGTPLHLVRRMDSIWRTRINDERELDGLLVSYQIIAPDGTAGQLGLTSGSSSAIRSTIHALAPVIVARDEDSLTIEGGAIWDMDLTEATSAGRYTGTLVIRIVDL